MHIGPGYSKNIQFRLSFFIFFPSIEGSEDNANQAIRTLASNRHYSQDKVACTHMYIYIVLSRILLRR